MHTVISFGDLRSSRLSFAGTVGLVPTMGYLHEGHLSLIRRARAECDHVVVSLFVNPTQFGPKEDLARYPRDLERDSRLIEPYTDLLWTPTAEIMYPPGYQTWVEVEAMTRPLEARCGRATSRASRPSSPSCSMLSSRTRPISVRKTLSRRL